MQKLTVLVLIALLIVPTLATAQDDWETYTLVDGTTIDYPAELEILETDSDIIFTNKADLQTESGLASFYDYNTGEFSVIVNDPTSNIDELFASSITDYSIATPEYVSGVLSGLYIVIYSFSSGSVFAGDSADIPALLIEDIFQLELDYDNQVVAMSDGVVDFYLITIVDHGDDVTLPPHMLNVTVTVAAGEFEQHEATIMPMIESITLAGME